MRQYSIWTVSPHTGSRHTCVGIYHNRGQALAKLRGLQRRAWLAGSELQFCLQRDR